MSKHPGKRERQEQSAADDISVGNVTGSIIAVGRGAWAVKIDLRLLPVVLLLLAVVGVLAYFLLRPQIPEQMAGDFNVAIARFAMVDEDGTAARGRDGEELASFVYRRMRDDFQELELPGIASEIWPPAYTGQVRGASREERENEAKALAERINADVLVYGVIVANGERSRFYPEFYVSYKGFAEAQEITGQHELGRELSVSLPFNASQVTPFDNPALAARANALSLATIGLAYYAIDDYGSAHDYFARAEAVRGWSSSAGKEVIYLLLGNASIRRSSKERTTAYLADAAAQYDAALAINPTYARAMLGKAGVFYLSGLGDPNVGGDELIDLALLDEAAALYQAALQAGSPPASANVETKVHFGLGRVEMARYLQARAVGGDRLAPLDRARAEFALVLDALASGTPGVGELAGQAHAFLGLADGAEGSVDLAIEHYKQAVTLVTPAWQSYCYAQLGELYAGLGQTAAAVEAYDMAVDQAEFYGDESLAKYEARLNELKGVVKP